MEMWKLENLVTSPLPLMILLRCFSMSAYRALDIVEHANLCTGLEKACAVMHVAQLCCWHYLNDVIYANSSVVEFWGRPERCCTGRWSGGDGVGGGVLCEASSAKTRHAMTWLYFLQLAQWHARLNLSQERHVHCSDSWISWFLSGRYFSV